MTSLFQECAATFLKYLRKTLVEMEQQSEAIARDYSNASDIGNFLMYKSDYLLNITHQACLVYTIPHDIVDLLEQIRHHVETIFELGQRESDLRLCKLEPGSKQRGRPRYDIPQDVITFYVQNRFTTREISELLYVSVKTIKRRMKAYGVSVSDTYTYMEPEELDQKIVAIEVC